MLLIYDRSEDPVSPLLNQWTYEVISFYRLAVSNNEHFSILIEHRQILLSNKNELISIISSVFIVVLGNGT